MLGPRNVTHRHLGGRDWKLNTEETRGEGDLPDEMSSRKGREGRLCKGPGWTLQPAGQRVGLGGRPASRGGRAGRAGLTCYAGLGLRLSPGRTGGC